METRRIGLLGGAFDPVHFGHLIIAEFIREKAGLNEIRFIPSGNHPFKPPHSVTAATHRLKMLESAIAGNPSFLVDDREIRRQGEITYTIDTVRDLRADFPGEEIEFFFLMGMDNVAAFARWKNAAELAGLCKFIVCARPGVEPPELPPAFQQSFQFMETPLLEISSNGIRERVRQSRSIRYLVPNSVHSYICSHKLYQETDGAGL